MSDERPEPGTVRPGGRTAKTREAVLRAAGDALAEDGFDRLDLAEIARRAGVGKTTVYRRWGTVPGLVADLLTEMAEESLPRTATGSLLGDLTAQARLAKADPKMWLAMTDIYGDLAHSPAFIAAFSNALNTLWEIGTAATLERYLAGRL